MKILSQFAAILLIIGVAFSSCQKAFSPEDEPINPLLSDSNYLSKMYIIDIDTQDTVNRYTYTYDSQKRVVRVYDSSYYPHLLAWGSNDYQYFYHPGDTLPYKLLHLHGDVYSTTGPDTLLITHFWYDANGRRVKDSIIGSSVITFGYTGIANYLYQNDKIICHKTDSVFDNGSWQYYFLKDTGTVVNGSLVSNSFWRDNDFNTVTELVLDNNPSPFAKLSNFKAWALLSVEEIYFNEIPQKNNIIKLTTKEYDNGVLSNEYETDFSGNVIYNAAGYPVQMIDAITNEKVVFVYRTL